MFFTHAHIYIILEKILPLQLALLIMLFWRLVKLSYELIFIPFSPS